MRLLKVKLQGVRRFEETDALLVADRLVAIVGPNEAGKTSLLSAIEQVDRLDDPLPSAMRTRQSTTALRVEALFELAPADREAISGIHDAERVVRLWVVRSESGTKWRLEPSPKRDLTHRRKALDALRAAGDDPEIEAAMDDQEARLTADAWATSLSLLESDADSLKSEELAAITQAAEMLAELDYDSDADEEEEEEEDGGQPAPEGADPHLRDAAVEALRSAAAKEAEPAPFGQVIKVLRDRIPTIVEFTEVDRDLHSEYDLDELASDIPPALANVADLAELDLAALREAIASGDHGTVRLLREGANDRLDGIFEEQYGQSDVALQLDTDGFLLRLLVRAEGGEDYVELSERSAGFQWFVALIAFLARRQYDRPLVLVDEIETHLHYAAQADVIDVLSQQTVAEQVIYTTHSAGALPPDLGRGVRAVVPVEGRQRSRVDNSFWTSGPGFTPLLFGLGAHTLAFAVPRFLIICEGASDAILLPTLLREASGLEQLPYRVAPGIANTQPSDLHLLDREGARVAYLVDGDSGGADHKAKLVQAGVEPERILEWQDLADKDVTPEDLVDLDLYVDAVNREGHSYWEGEALRPEDLRPRGRAKAVTEWCKQRGLQVPSKVRVSQNLIENAWGWLAAGNDAEDERTYPEAVSTEEGRAWLARLHEAVLDTLGIE